MLSLYINKETGIYLSYCYHNNSDLNANNTDIKGFHGSWSFGSSEVLAYNPFCVDAHIPANGGCDFGWHYFNPDQHANCLDPTAYVICRTPKYVTEAAVPSKSVCTKFELTSNKGFEEDYLTFFLGEYELTDTAYNAKAVYHKFDPVQMQSIFLYFYRTSNNRKFWAIGNKLRSEKVSIFNEYCADLEFPTSGECDAGWFYFSGKSQKWEYDSSFAIQCKEYDQ